jgi:hypothetical protein
MLISEVSMNNVFNIPNAERCNCTIVNYIKGHSQLHIRVYNPVNQTTISIGFEGVEYIECPVTWGSAAFYYASDSDCIGVLQKVGRYNDVPKEYLLEKFHLYTVLSPDNEEGIIVRILARNGGISRNT